jgi:hypothetical protein
LIVISLLLSANSCCVCIRSFTIPPSSLFRNERAEEREWEKERTNEWARTPVAPSSTDFISLSYYIPLLLLLPTYKYETTNVNSGGSSNNKQRTTPRLLTRAWTGWCFAWW